MPDRFGRGLAAPVRCSSLRWLLPVLLLAVVAYSPAAPVQPRGGPKIVGTASFQYAEGVARFTVARITNTSPVRSSGPLRAELWALTAPFRGGAYSGVQLGAAPLAPLAPRASHTNVTARGPVSDPPAAKYYVTVMLKEQSDGQWRLCDYLNFPATSVSGMPVLNPPPTGPLTNAAPKSVPLAPGITYDNLMYNLNRLNAYRAQKGAPALVLDAQLTAFALQGSQQLLRDHVAHNHFKTSNIWSSGFARNAAENQGDAHGWPARPVDTSIDQILQMMMNEGPGGGHHDNILNPAFRRVGIGLLKDEHGRLYFTNDFSG